MSEALLAWLAASLVAGGCWAVCGMAMRRARHRRSASRPRPVLVRWAPDATAHPHPLHEDTVWVDAESDAEAWATISGEAA